MDKTYFIIKLGKKWMSFWCSPGRKMREVLDSCYINYECYESQAELDAHRGLRRFIKVAKSKNVDYFKLPAYIVLGIDGSWWSGMFTPGILEDLCNYYKIEFYKFESMSCEEYKNKMRELLNRREEDYD